MRCSVLVPRAFLMGLALSSAVGCASTATPTQRSETAYIPGASGALTINAGQGPVVSKMVSSIDQVWRVLPAVFDTLGIPLTIIDPRRHVIGNEGVKVRQRLGKTRLSTFFDCGTTQVGPNADSYELYLTVMTQLDPDATGTKMTTSVTAAAKPMQFAQDYSRCASSDALENRIAELVAAALKK